MGDDFEYCTAVFSADSFAEDRVLAITMAVAGASEQDELFRQTDPES
jgi:hypothetical protein